MVRASAKGLSAGCLWGASKDLAAVLERHPKAKVVLLTHNETSTGLTNPLEALARVAHKAGRIVVVDGVSSISSIAIDTDAWAVLLLLALGVVQILTDVLFSVKASDWKKFRREMRLAR